MSIKCSACGTDNPDGSKFCRKCGSKIIADSKEESVEQAILNTEGMSKAEKAEAETSSTEILKNQTPVKGADDACPYCGANGCQMVQRTSTKIKQSNYGLGSGCCGLILLGPFGLLCGLCGAGSKVDIKNETWFICPVCGKQHISRADAMNKTRAMAFSAFLITLAGAALISCSIWLQSFSWITAASFIVPVVSWYSLYTSVKDELGNSPLILFTYEQKKKYFIIFAVSVIIALLIGWRIFALASQ